MRKTLKRGVLGRGLAVMAIVGLTLPVGFSPASAADCADKADVSALVVRDLQSRLMVAALSCNAKADYNTFATRYQTALVDHGKRLKAYFSKAYGKSGEHELNRFITQLANGHSSRSVDDRGEFCSQSATLFQSVLSGSQSLEDLALKTTTDTRRITSSCNAQTFVASLRD